MTPPRIARAQRSALILLVFAGTLNYVDRATLAVANPLIRQELGLSIADMGLLLSAFLWAYAFAQLPGGALLDRLGPRRVLGRRPRDLVRGAGDSGLRRGLLAVRPRPSVPAGLGESPMFSGAVRVVRDWYNVARAAACRPGSGTARSSLGPTIARRC